MSHERSKVCDSRGKTSDISPFFLPVVAWGKLKNLYWPWKRPLGVTLFNDFYLEIWHTNHQKRFHYQPVPTVARTRLKRSLLHRQCIHCMTQLLVGFLEGEKLSSFVCGFWYQNNAHVSLISSKSVAMWRSIMGFRLSHGLIHRDLWRAELLEKIAPW